MATQAPAGTDRLPAQVTKVGNLTRPVELRVSEKGEVWASSGLAVDVPVNPGDWSETTTHFYDLCFFRELAEHVSQSLTKGDRVIVQGRPQVRTWEDDDGTARSAKQILVTAVGPELRFATAQVERTRPTPESEEPF